MSRRHSALAVGAATALTAALAGLAACSDSNPPAVAPVPLGPAAYGEQIGKTFDCYYIDDQQEALNLIAAGLCPPSAVPTVMPPVWHETYYSYYASTAYSDVYVPVSYRSGWVNQSSAFYRANYTTIVVVQKNAVYKGSNGKPLTGAQLGTKPPTFAAPTLSGGNRAAPTLGGGNARNTGAASSSSSAAPVLGGGNARKPATPPKGAHH